VSIAGWGFQATFYLALPAREAGYFLLVLYVLICALTLRRPAVRLPRDWARSLGVAAGLAVATVLASGLFTIELTSSVAPSSLSGGGSASFPLLGALPWMSAAGFLGDLPAAALGLLAGVVRGGWGTQRLLTPFGLAAQAAVFGWLIRRPYAEWPGRLARRPLPSALATGALFGVLRTIEEFAYLPGDPLAAVDRTMAALGPTVVASLLELGLAGGITAALRGAVPGSWRAPAQLTLGPYNRSLAARLTTVVLSLGIAGGAALTYGNWLLSRTSAQRILSDQMAQTAVQVAEAVPYFIQTGRTQLRSIADALPAGLPLQEIGSQALAASVRELAYFSQVAVFDSQGVAWAGWPSAFPAIDREIEIAAQAGAPQELVVGGGRPEEPVELVFLTPLTAEGQTVGMLAGWTALNSNPLLEPLNARLASHGPGEAFVLDGLGRVILHPNPARWLERPGYADPGKAGFFRSADPTGSRSWVYSHAVEGYPWRVIITTPQSAIDALALSTTVNLFLLLFSVGGVLVAAVHLGTRRLTRPLREMASTAEAIAQGDLDRQVPPAAEDEIGRLAGAFERMRLALKARLGELNLLLATGRRMAESFDLGEALPIVLNRVRELIDVDYVRLVLQGSDGQLEGYSAGSPGRGWESLDPGILDLTRRRGQFALENPARAGAVLDFGGIGDDLEALIGFPVRHETNEVGALWIGHGRPRSFSKSEVRLLSIFAGQLAISVENLGLYRQAERERSRLLAILSSTPDAVIVTDGRGRISLANPAADVALTIRAEQAIGRPIAELVRAPELAALLTEPLPTTRSTEIKLEDGRVLFASASEVAGGHQGRVCVLSDITHYKVLDSLKSEFVSTVSHDLRSPLTLMRGYASMVANVGAVNGQQQELLEKIQASVTRMTKLVDDLLDLGRIESGIGLSLERVEIPAVFQEVLTSYRPLALNKQVALEVQLGPSLEPIQADPVLLRQAIANLVDNAIKYSQPGGRVLLRAEQAEGRQIVQVQDSGAGIASADQPRLFEKFFRVGEGKGAGLGLAIVKSIVDQHHGRVGVESRLGRGSTFTLSFPMRLERSRAAA
jgi:PAS domain S-box-containing protein